MANSTLERHPAVVTSTDDPEQRGRIRVACAAISGDEDSELPDFVEMAPQWGWFQLPDVGEVVEIEVITGNEHDESFGQSSIDTLNATWRCVRFYGNEQGATPTPIHDDFKTNYGKRRGFATPNGQVLWFDDTQGQEKIQLTWKQGDSKFQYLTFDETGSAILANSTGSLIHLDAKNGEAKVIDENGNLYNSTKDGIKIIDKNSNIIEMKSGVVQILSQDAVIISAKSLNVKTGSVDLIDGADDHIPRGEDLLDYINNTIVQIFNTHMVPTAMGPSGPPLTPMTNALPALLSVNGKIK